MSSPHKTAADLLRLAADYARERQAPVQTLVKELLHFELLQAMTISGALENLVFQGGTCLRLCYEGNRYSEDLDFAGGHDFKAETLEAFTQLLQERLATTYGLGVDVKSREVDSDGLHLVRWQARISVPQADPSLPQKQVINIEVANVPAHDVDLVPVRGTYPHLQLGHQSLMVLAESRNEILADKIKALVARPFMKSRDIWDLKFLVDQGLRPDFDLVQKKLADYGWSIDAFHGKAQARVAELENPASVDSFRKEMSRFVDARVARQLETRGVAEKYLAVSRRLVQDAMHHLAPPAVAFAAPEQLRL